MPLPDPIDCAILDSNVYASAHNLIAHLDFVTITHVGMFVWAWTSEIRTLVQDFSLLFACIFMEDVDEIYSENICIYM